MIISDVISSFACAYTLRTPGIRQTAPPMSAAKAMAAIKLIFPGWPITSDAPQAATIPIKKEPSMDKLKSPGLKRIITASPVNISGVIPSITLPKRLRLVNGPNTKSPKASKGASLISRIMANTISSEINIANIILNISILPERRAVEKCKFHLLSEKCKYL